MPSGRATFRYERSMVEEPAKLVKRMAQILAIGRLIGDRAGLVH